MNERFLTFYNFNSIIITGEPTATIRCWDAPIIHLNFNSIPNVTIRRMHILNCNCTFRDHDHDSVAEIEILNSRLTNCRLIFRYLGYG